MAKPRDNDKDKISSLDSGADTFRWPKPLAAPSFGQASQLRSPLTTKSAFLVPKAGKPRPEHHRDIPRYSSGDDSDVWKDPVELMNQRLKTQPVSIQAPSRPEIKTIHKPPPAKYSSYHTPFSNFAKDDELKKDLESQGLSRSDAALFEDRYSGIEALESVDPIKAAKDVKALLEGAFDEDEDKPRTRRQKKKLADALNGLTSQVNDLKVKDDLYPDLKTEDSDKENSDARPENEEDEDEDDGTREGLRVKLLAHQIDGVDWMIRQEVGTKSRKAQTKGGILADDMGLGKTIQTIAMMLLNPRPKGKDTKISPGVSKSTLVVAPLALIKQWERELEDKIEDTHYLKVLVHHGPKRTKSGDELRRYDVVITTYQTITSEHESSSPKDDGPKVGCFDVNWYRVILDEAHTIKNKSAKCTKGCYALRSEYRWCLTGTPMQNHLDELHSLIHFLRVKSFMNRNVWKEKITEPMSKGKAQLAIQRLQAILKSVMKRRTKDVLRKQAGFGEGETNSAGFKLVGRKVEVVTAKFSPREQAFYQQLLEKADSNLERMMSKDELNFAGALALLLRLRQACNHKELVNKKLYVDGDELEVISKSVRSKSPSKSQSASQDVDDLADLLGGLGVATKRCELCGSDLSKDETASKMIRCADCEALVAGEEADTSTIITKTKKHSRKPIITMSSQRQQRNRRVLVDSDDDDDEGDWIVPENQRSTQDLGKAGGTDDEDADGGGEWIGTEDSDTDDNSSIKIVHNKNKVVSLTTTDESVTELSDNYEEVEESGNPGTLGISTKIQTLLKILRKESSEHKFIVFSEWTSMLNLIEPFLKAEKINFCRYDGKMKNEDREKSLDQLRNDKQTRVLLCSLKCGSLGLNLTAASRVIIMEPFWNPFVEEQAIDRVHRLNQTVDVKVYRLTIEGTVEQRIFDLQNQKRQLAEAAIEGKAVAKMSMNELLNLFKHDAEHYVQGTKLGDFMLGKAKNPPNSTSSSSQRPEVQFLGSRQRVPEKKQSSRPEHAVYGRRW